MADNVGLCKHAKRRAYPEDSEAGKSTVNVLDLIAHLSLGPLVQRFIQHGCSFGRAGSSLQILWSDVLDQGMQPAIPIGRELITVMVA
jgi:hypothetical protein